MESIYHKIRNNLKKLKINNNSILVAISGGKDSMTLLNLLFEIKKEFNLKLYAAYINHNLRDKESLKEEKFVTNYLKEKEILFFKYSVEKDFWKKLKNDSIEMAARNIRYDFFKKICKENKIDFIATAHNFNDKVETFFLNLMRGSGMDALSSIPMKNKNIIRPILNVTRNEIEEYIASNNIKFVEDSSNKENIYKRNIIRNELLPVLSRVKPDFLKSFKLIFDFMDEEKHLVNSITEKYYKKILIYKGVDYYCLNNLIFKKLPDALQKNIIKKILRLLNYPLKPNFIMLNSLSGKKKKYLYKNKNLYSISRNENLWLINIINNFNFLNKNLNVEKLPFSFNDGKYKITLNKKVINDPKLGFTFKDKKNILPIKIRNLNKNDVIYINNKNKKKIINILKDKKIPNLLFNKTIVAEDSKGEIIGFIFNRYFRVSHNYYINDKSKKNLILEVMYD